MSVASHAGRSGSSCRAWVLLVVLASCRHATYARPGVEEAHAVVSVELSYASMPGPEGATRVLIDGAGALRDRRPTVDAPLTTTLRVRPGVARWHVSTSFWDTADTPLLVVHDDLRTCGAQSTLSGAIPAPCTQLVSTLETAPLRSETGQCSVVRDVRVQAGLTYLLQFSFFADSQCSLQCFVQTPSAAPGGFTLAPCPQ